MNSRRRVNSDVRALLLLAVMVLPTTEVQYAQGTRDRRQEINAVDELDKLAASSSTRFDVSPASPFSHQRALNLR